MFAHIVEKKKPAGIQLPAMKPDGTKFTRIQRQNMVNDAYKALDVLSKHPKINKKSRGVLVCTDANFLIIST